MIESDYLTLLYKRLTNGLSAEEKSQLDGQLQGKKKDKELLNLIFKADDPVNDTRFKPDVDAGLSRLKNRIAKEKAKETPVVKMPTKRFIGLRIAAALLFLVVAGALIWNQFGTDSGIHSIASGDSVQNVTLADGTVVWLNANSELEFPATFEGDLRTVKLSGEAYFDVASNPDQPFVVRTSNGYVRVLGTEFNVFSPKESSIEFVQVYEGLVEYVVEDGKGKAQLKAGTGAEFDIAAAKLRKSEFAIPDNLIAWKTGKLHLNGENLEEILNILSDHFNVTFAYDQAKYGSCVFTFVADSNSLENSLLIIEKTQGLSFEKIDEFNYRITGDGCK